MNVERPMDISDRRKEWLAPAFLLLLSVSVYGNILLNGFTLDDDLYIFRNQAVTHPSFGRLLQPNPVSNVFRPITFATFALNWVLGHAHPWGYHLFNLLLHAVVAVLAYLLLKSLLDAAPQGGRIAFVAAALFAVHPIHTEAVASIPGRAELLAAAFLLAAWLFHLRDRPFLSLLCFLFALLSKESAVVFFPLVLIGDYGRGKLKRFDRYVAVAGTTLLYLAFLWEVQGYRFGQAQIAFLDNPLASLPAGWRILNAIRVGWKYVALQAFPVTLSCDYSYAAFPLYADWRHTLAPALAAVLMVALWAWALWRRRTAWALGGTIYLVSFAVTSNVFISTGTIMGERLAYFPSLGFCLLVALLWIFLEGRNRTSAWTILTILVVSLAVRAGVRNRDWRDNLALYSSAVRAVPGSAKMHANLGGMYFLDDQPEAAERELRVALQIEPNFPDAVESYGLVESRLGRNQEALALLQKALSMTAKTDINYNFRETNLAALLLQVGDDTAALNLLNQQIAESPAYARAWANRAVLFYKRGEPEAALADAHSALQLDPGNTQAQNLVRILSQSGSAPLR